MSKEKTIVCDLCKEEDQVFEVFGGQYCSICQMQIEGDEMDLCDLGQEGEL